MFDMSRGIVSWAAVRGRMAGRWVAWLVVLAACPSVWALELNGFRLDDALVPPGEIQPGGPPRDGIPAIDHPVFVPAAEARHLKLRDRVLGVERGGRAVLADRVGGQSIRIEFDPEARTGRVFDAEGRELPSLVAFWFAWLAFHPDTALYDGK